MKIKLETFPLIVLCICISACFGWLADVPQTTDGYLTEGEYAQLSVSLEGSEELYVTGGGANEIEARDHSYLEVQYTSTPLSNSSGIYDIFLGDNSELLYLNGITEEISIGGNATAILKGGTISGITIYHGPTDSCYVTIFCQEGYTKTNSGISGLWVDGTSFDIGFNNSGPYTTAPYVNIIPEPVTLVLLGLGGLLIRRKR